MGEYMIFEIIKGFARSLIISWNSFHQNTREGISVVLVITTLLVLALRIRGYKKQRAYRGWNPLKPTRKKDGIIAIHFKEEPSSGRTGSGYRTGNREYDSLVDYYSIPGTLERTEKKKKGDR